MRTLTTDKVFSTYVEVILVETVFMKSTNCFLHVCGGDPNLKECLFDDLTFSPRMWRWSYTFQTLTFQNLVFSTYVEVIPKLLKRSCTISGFLHVCGGDPELIFNSFDHREFSPRMWRWSRYNSFLQQAHPVFSTYVEVILSFTTCRSRLMKFSPRMWRWSPGWAWHIAKQKVFSTYVEVILAWCKSCYS